MLYVPGFSYNLLSVAKLIDTRKRVAFYATQCEITDKKERLVAVALKKGGLYSLNCKTQSQSHTAHVVKKSVYSYMAQKIWSPRKSLFIKTDKKGYGAWSILSHC